MILYLDADLPTAAEAVSRARSLEGLGLGFRVGPRLLARSGTGAVTAVRAFGPVLADARLAGDGGAVVAAARVLATGGAGRVTLAPGTGPDLAARVAEALDPFGALAVVAAAPPEASDDDIDVVTLGVGRGRAVSRLVAALPTGVELLGTAGDLGVAAQVAPGLGVVVTGILDAEAASVVAGRGAVALALAPGVGSDPDTARAFIAATG